MTIRLWALAAMLLTACFHLTASGQEQSADGQCNCPKCQAARQAAVENAETLAAQPAGMFSPVATGVFASESSDMLPGFGQWFQAQTRPLNEVQQAGHKISPSGPYIRNPGPGPGSHGRRPGAASYGSGTFPYGTPYDHFHAGKPFDGGRYGYFGGAHRTPGYPHHHFHREYVGPQGPPSAQVAYPYYTIRGPRDFFLDNPPSIGR